MTRTTAASPRTAYPRYTVLPRDPQIKPRQIGAWMARVDGGWIVTDDRDRLARFVEPELMAVEATTA